MKKTIKLSENDLTRLVQKVINEQSSSSSQNQIATCSSNVISRVKNHITDESRKESIKIETGASFFGTSKPGDERWLFITTPDGKKCACKKSIFFSV